MVRLVSIPEEADVARIEVDLIATKPVREAGGRAVEGAGKRGETKRCVTAKTAA